MTNHFADIGNADAVLIMGSNAAEHHPIAFKWVLRAKDKGAPVIHVDPKFSRTSARTLKMVLQQQEQNGQMERTSLQPSVFSPAA